MIRISLVTASLVLASSSAFAGNLSEPVVVAPPVVPMTVMAPSNDWSGFYLGGQYVTGDLSDGFTSGDLDGFGVHAGYLADLGSFVLGGELDYDMLDVDGLGDVDVLRLKAIAGYDMGSFMPYITAGAAKIDVESVGDDSATFYGLGGTYQFTDSFRIGGEYLKHESDDFAGSGFNLEADTFSLRASFSF